MRIDFYNVTLDELRAIDNFRSEERKFTSFVIVPTGEIHDSNFGCFKIILIDDSSREIVGAIGGYCDIIHLNGIGGYGLNFDASLKSGKTSVIDWKIDILPVCNCVRIHCRYPLSYDEFIGSDFQVYAKIPERKRK